MSKKDKQELKERVESNNLDDKDKRVLAYDGLIRPCIYMVIFLGILIFSLFNDNHLLKFSHIMFNSTDLAKMLYIMYYLVLSMGLFFALISLGIGIYNYIKKSDLSLYKVGIFYDVYSFIINAIIMIFFILVFLFTPCVVSGESMNNTLNDGDRLILWDMNTNYKNNDIVVFSGEEYVNDDIMVIKRVVASPGDRLYYDLSTTSFYVNDEFVENISYSAYSIITQSGKYTTVPDNKLVVFGDNRQNSLDSRYFGFIDYADIYGKAIWRIFPLNEMKLLD